MNCEIKDCENPATQVIKETIQEDESVLPLQTGGAKISYPQVRDVCDIHAQELLEEFPNVMLLQSSVGNESN